MLNLHPIDKNGQKIKTDVDKKDVILALLARVQIAAANATAASADAILAATALTGTTQTITAGITQPTTPRNVSITGNQAGIVGNVVVTGKNYAGETITETIAAAGAATVEGVKAFAEIDEIELPAEINVGTDTISIGVGEKLGIPYRLPHDTVVAAYLNNAKEGTAPTVTVSTTALESNTIDLDSALNGTAIDYYLMV